MVTQGVAVGPAWNAERAKREREIERESQGKAATRRIARRTAEPSEEGSGACVGSIVYRYHHRSRPSQSAITVGHHSQPAQPASLPMGLLASGRLGRRPLPAAAPSARRRRSSKKD
ncbi:hypothetical protein ACQY0O_006923 [Thecaphora frezii]